MAEAFKSTLIKKCREVLKYAYAPYSKFPVGAALLSENDNIYVGVNVENISFPVGWCGEISAISNLISAGEKKIKAVAVTTKYNEFTTPCGRCRQALWEFAAKPDITVYLVNDNGEVKETKLNLILPDAPAIECLSQMNS